MDPAITDEILGELSSALQRIEAQSSAILEFVKDKGIVKENELAPYLERANAASSVRWRATRVRLERLLSGLEKRQESKEQRNEEGQKSEADKASEPKSIAMPESDEGPPQQSKVRMTARTPRSQSGLPIQIMTALLEVAIRNRASASRSRAKRLTWPRRSSRPIKPNHEILSELPLPFSEGDLRRPETRDFRRSLNFAHWGLVVAARSKSFVPRKSRSSCEIGGRCGARVLTHWPQLSKFLDTPGEF